MLFRDAEVDGRQTDVLVDDGVITAVGPGLKDDDAFDCGGGALLPGLHDHHCHLFATVAARTSIACGPPEVRTHAELARVLRKAPATGWLRGVGYHESVAGLLDRAALDAIRNDVPVRVQERSGALWIMNSRGVEVLELDASEQPGVERDANGVPTGRLWRSDDWLRDRLAADNNAAAGLAELSAELAAYGVVGVTDATPNLDGDAAQRLSAAMRQHVVVLGDRKIVVPDHTLPALPALIEQIATMRPRPVAVHCVTRAALVLILAALDEIGVAPGDRIEHAAVVPTELRSKLREFGITVVTQPSLPYLRGDGYLDDVDPFDVPHLWPFRSLLDAGIPVGCSSDAPYGALDPWISVAAAARRRTVSDRRIGPDEQVPPSVALRGYLTQPDSPGGPTRQVAPGCAADLVLLDRPVDEALTAPSSEHVRATMIAGKFVHRR